MLAESEDLRSALDEKEAQLVRLSHSMDKMKQELVQKEELVKQRDAELTRRFKEIQRLDEKIHRVDSLTAELLEAQEHRRQSETQLRDKDFELGQLKQQLKAVEDEKLAAKAAERKMRDRSENLQEQVRIEVERAADLEERAHDSEEAVAVRTSLLAEVDRLAGAAQDADLLVASARRVQRELADQLALARAEQQQLRAELAAARRATASEADGLRRELAVASADGERHRRAAAGHRSLVAEVRRQFPGTGPWIDAHLAEARRRRSHGGGGGGSSGRLLNGRPSSSAPRVRLRSSDSRDSDADDVAAASASAAAAGSGDNTACAPSRTDQEAAAEAEESPRSSVVARRRRRHPRGPSRQLRDRIAGLHIHLGDRVAVRLGACDGRQEAIVKYVGTAGTGGAASGGVGKREGVRYGLKLLDRAAAAAAAAAAGVEASAEFRSDVLVPASRIDAVFCRKTNSFRQLDSLIENYLETSASK